MYQKRVLRDLCSSINYGYTASASRDQVGPKFLRITDIAQSALDWDGVPYCPIEDKDFGKYRLSTGDIVIARTGATAGWAKYIADPPPAVFASYLVRIRLAESVDARFVGHVVESKEYKDFVLQHAGGAAQPNANAQVLTSYELPLPPLPIQRRIASILSAYDDLIENNRKRIAILEDMARRLYREWFVHFRYPGHEGVPLVDSPLGRIPRGWTASCLGRMCDNFDRKRRPLSGIERQSRPGPYRYYGAAKPMDSIDAFIFDGEYLLLAEDGSVITDDRRPMLQLVNEKFWPNNHTHILQGRAPASTHFLYLALNCIDISPYITGAAQPKITQENMNRIPLVCATDAVHSRFDAMVGPMIQLLQNLERQIIVLRRTRDLLLPRLMSGTISVEALATAEAAVP